MDILLNLSVTILNALGFLFVMGFALLPVWAAFTFLRTRDARTILLKLTLYYAIAISLRFAMVDVPLMALGYLNELTAESAAEIHRFSHTAVEIIEGNEVVVPTATPELVQTEPTPVITNLIPTVQPTAAIVQQVVTATPLPPDWIPEIKDEAVATFDASSWKVGDPLPTPSQ